MSDPSSNHLFSQLALTISAVGAFLYGLAVVFGLFAASVLSGGMGLIIAIPVFVVIYIFVALVLQRWNKRHEDPYADLEE